MECAVCDEEVDSQLQLDGIVMHMIVAGEPRPVHVRCCGGSTIGRASEEE